MRNQKIIDKLLKIHNIFLVFKSSRVNMETDEAHSIFITFTQLASHPPVAGKALGFALPSHRSGDASFFQKAGIVCMQGKQKTPRSKKPQGA